MSPLPDVSDALDGLTDSFIYQKSAKVIDSAGEAAERLGRPTNFEGVVAPLGAQRLIIKPEGQRAWKWAKLWTSETLEKDWVVIDAGGTQYRVQNRLPYSGAGFYEYEIAESPR